MYACVLLACVLLACLLPACALQASPAQAAHYQVVTEEWAPYNYLQDNELQDHDLQDPSLKEPRSRKVTGMTTEVVRAIMAITGDDFPITLLPSMRSSHVLQTQPKTILYSMFRTPERERRYKWVGPIVEEIITPWQLANSLQPINSREQLQQAPQITTRQAGLIPDSLQAQGFRNLDRSASDNRQLYSMLLAGRTPVIVGDTAAGVAYYSQQLGIAPGTLRQIPLELYRASLYIAFSPDSDDRLVATWSRALEQLRHNGELERIRQRYEQPAGQQ